VKYTGPHIQFPMNTRRSFPVPDVAAFTAVKGVVARIEIM
jgi:hypothetical protein